MVNSTSIDNGARREKRSRRRQERRGWPLVKGASPRPEKRAGYSQRVCPTQCLKNARFRATFLAAPTQTGLSRSRHLSQTSMAPADEDGRENDVVDRRPAESFEQLAGGERADRHAAEDQEIVERLHLVALLGRWHCVTMVVAPMKAKFQPKPSSTSAVQKCATVMPDNADIAAASAISASPSAVMRSTPKRDDQRAGDEARRIHRQHVPLDAERRVGHRMAAADHGERRRSHHHVHHRVAGDAAGDRDDEARRRARSRRAGAPRRRAFGASGGDLHELQHQRGEQRAGRLPEIARREQMRRQQVLGEDDELRPDHRGENAAGQHPGHDLRADRLRSRCRRRRSGRTVRGGVEPAAERAEQQQPERSRCITARVGDQPGEDAEGRAASAARSGGRSGAPACRPAACRTTCRTPCR